MNAQQRIAIAFAETNLKGGKAVLSNDFFSPFNQKQSQEVVAALLLKGIIACSISNRKKSCLLVHTSFAGRVGDTFKEGIGVKGLNAGYDLTVVNPHPYLLEVCEKV